MSKSRPYVLSVAGFDPGGGAGVLADVKTFEAHKVYGLGVVSALTVQNDTTFSKVEWLGEERIIEQIEMLLQRFKFSIVKIGLIENLATLSGIASYLKSRNPDIQIIWDPVLKASAGFTFHETISQPALENVCKELFLVTPNIPEAIQLGTGEDAKANAKALSSLCNVFLKGGHSVDDAGRDFLYSTSGKEYSFAPKGIIKYPKHGSGCVLSSAIVANLAKGYQLQRACLLGKQYTAQFLNSHSSLTGFHKI